VWSIFYYPSPNFCHSWRRFLLRCFGAKIGKDAHPYPKVHIWAPWNLVMGDYSCLANHVICYSVDKIVIGENSIVSQYSHLCTASHDSTLRSFPLTTAPIVLGANVWITTDVYIAPGVTIGDGTVVSARSSVFSDLPAWCIARGNPAVPVKKRHLDLFN
jgi:putative colanic acid biosynthesis acetyltransferase WcaF